MTYISFEEATSEAEHPLIYCIAMAFPAGDRKDYWFYIPNIFDMKRAETAVVTLAGISADSLTTPGR